MRREAGFSVISLVISIVIIMVIVGVIIFVGCKVINQYKEEDTEFNKTEMVDALNSTVKAKYILDSKYAQENKKNIDEIYSAETVIQYLLESKYIEQLKDVNDNLVENQYFINPDYLHSDIATNTLNENGSAGNGTKIFKLKKVEDKYLIYFVDKYGNEEQLGELIMKPEV